jgi:hypothetical protein
MANNGHWKGGKTYHKDGYVMVRVPEHPRASGGYVFEHILAMEEHLGRRLEGDENVHHKNGVKDDNRIKNLELWCGPQPSGARVSDLVEWATELLTKYAPERLSRAA